MPIPGSMLAYDGPIIGHDLGKDSRSDEAAYCTQNSTILYRDRLGTSYFNLRFILKLELLYQIFLNI